MENKMIKSNLFVFLFSTIFSSLSFASAGVVEKKLKKDSFKDRLYQSDYLYFITGDPDTKVNFSFGFELSKKYDFVFEYNQTMFWDLGKQSSPFRDVNFNPMFIKRFDIWNIALDVGMYEHHSNGVDGPDSRSYDSSYIFPKYLYKMRYIDLHLGVKARVLYNLSDLNSNLREYFGTFELAIGTSFKLSQENDRSIKLNLTSSPGGNYDNLYQYGYNKIDLIYDHGNNEVPVNFHIQFYYGYTESLIAYDKKHKSIRVGVSL